MIAALVLTLAQVAPATAPQRFSILADPCASATSDAGKDVVVCGRPDGVAPRLPNRDDRGPPDHAVPSNPELRATQAMNLEATPCGATQRGCTVGFGPPLVPTVKAAAGLVKSAFARRPDKRGRVPIDLGDPPAPPASAIAP